MLLGGGHAHVFVLKAFGKNPALGVRLTLIAKETAATYSGMLPGFVAGHYGLDDIHIDLERLAQYAGARMIHGAADGIDRAAKRVSIEGQPPVPYDVLSINVGVTPRVDDIAGASEHALLVKPISSFAAKWRAFEQRALMRECPRAIVAVGGGAAGIELVLAARHRLRTLAVGAGIDPNDFSFALVAGGGLLPSQNDRARRLARAALFNAGVKLIEHNMATRMTATSVEFSDGSQIASDCTLVSTDAAAPAWFSDLDLPRDAEGFVAVRPTLQSPADDDVFAVGDCASVIGHPRPKSGVFAVRQGPVIAENLRRRAAGRPTKSYFPQLRFLSLISLGDRRAIAARGGFAAAGAWAWRLKDWIDRAFVRQFTDLP
ncbi:MAG: FAD-dependent oxidoreductase [Hyphomicrobium sp.]